MTLPSQLLRHHGFVACASSTAWKLTFTNYVHVLLDPHPKWPGCVSNALLRVHSEQAVRYTTPEAVHHLITVYGNLRNRRQVEKAEQLAPFPLVCGSLAVLPMC